MGRDVEFNYTASDKTGPASASVVNNMQKTGKKVEGGLLESIGKVSPQLAKKLTGVIGSVGVPAGKLLAGGLVVSAPVIGATISAAIIGAAGVGGVIGGVALVSRDPRVQAAGQQLGKTLLSGLEQDAEPFIAPVLAAVDTIEDRFERMRPRLQRIFANSAGFVAPLTDGVLRGVDGVLRGVDRLIAEGQPVILALGDSFGVLGESVGNAFETIAGGSDDAASGLTAVAHVTGETIEVVGYLVRGLTEAYGVISFLPEKIVALERSMGLLDKEAEIAAHNVGGLKDNTVLMGMHAAGAEGPIVTLTDKINGLSQATRTAFDAETQVGAAIDAVTAARKENGRTLDANTEKGRANRGVLSGLAQALIGQYNATVAVNGEGAKSVGVANKNRDAFIRLAQKLGASKTEAAALATQLGLLPAKKETTINTNAPAARARVAALQAELNRIPRNINVAVTVRTTRKGETLYGNQAPQFDAAGSSYYRAGQGDGVHRTGAPTPVQVASSVTVNLDGTPFYAMSTKAANQATSRAAWRTKVGRR